MTNKKPKELSYKEVWETLRAVNTESLEYKKQSLTYIGWADAYACLIEHYPEATYVFDEPVFYGDEGSKTCEVGCTIYIGNLERTIHLPVMTSGMPMTSIVNPTSRDINDARQRAFVKTCGMFGLGLHLWERKTYESKSNLGTGEMPF